MLVLFTPHVWAAEPKFEETLKDPLAVAVGCPETDLEVTLGGAWNAGNTDFFVASGSFHGTHRWTRNQYQLGWGATYGRGRADADGNGTLSEAEREAARVETMRRLVSDSRYDRYFGKRNSLYVSVGGLVDPFTGYDLRTHEQVGWSRMLIERDRTRVIAELGIDYAQERYVSAVEPRRGDVFAGRVMVGLDLVLSDTVGLHNSLETYENMLDRADLRVANDAALTSALSESLRIKLENRLMYDHQPVEGFVGLDSTTLVSLEASLL
jgi:putative salt-induced outer membrane protein YdiY